MGLRAVGVQEAAASKDADRSRGNDRLVISWRVLRELCARLRARSHPANVAPLRLIDVAWR